MDQCEATMKKYCLRRRINSIVTKMSKSSYFLINFLIKSIYYITDSMKYNEIRFCIKKKLCYNTVLIMKNYELPMLFEASEKDLYTVCLINTLEYILISENFQRIYQTSFT